MGVSKKKVSVKPKAKKTLSKKDLVKKRATRLQKIVETKRKLKRQIKAKKSSLSLKSKKQKEADNEIIDYSTKNDINVNNNLSNDQANILSILGIGNQNNDWQKQLEQKLQEINSKSLDNPQVRKIYAEVGRIFTTYRSGKIPKAFKIIPKLEKWQQALELTRPDQWTPQAMYQAVVVFASNMDPTRSETFFKKYLSPAISKDLQKNKKLNYHYYESLKKALYKTNSWFKGILFEFSSTSTHLREIKVLQSLLSKMTIPVISSSVALIKLMQFQSCNATIHYLLAIISKHYNLPRRVISNMVDYLLKFQKTDDEMPVIWQQLFLNFVKQYANGIDQMKKGALQNLAKTKNHKQISPQILKALSDSM